jgi:histidine phosphotransfer protein HptB
VTWRALRKPEAVPKSHRNRTDWTVLRALAILKGFCAIPVDWDGMTEAEMIDWPHVDGLREDLGDGFDELVEVFLDEVDSGIARLNPGATPAQMASDLHFLKGAALNLGFVHFAGLCGDGEDRAGRGGGVDLAPILASLDASRVEFLRGLAERRAA